jgi:ribosomal protein S8
MKIKVRWFDGYIEEFDAEDARSGAYILWIKLKTGEDRWIPLSQVRWFSGLK